MEKYDVIVDYSGLIDLKNTWNSDRLESLKNYNQAIRDLVDIDYCIKAAKMFLLSYDNDPSWAITELRKKAVNDLQSYKDYRGRMHSKINHTLKPALQRNTILADKALTAFKWVDETLDKYLLKGNPRLKEVPAQEFYDTYVDIRNTAQINFEWMDPMCYTIRKQKVTVHLSFKTVDGAECNITKTF